MEKKQIEMEEGVPFPGEILPPEKWSRTGLKKLPLDDFLNWESIFHRNAPKILDLGCGNGRFLIGHALSHPEFDHLGIDILPVVIRYATRRANKRGLTNIRFAVRGAYEFLEELILPHTIREIHIYHPQPYHDVEKASKRLLTPLFLSYVYESLEPNGIFILQTDNLPYWNYMQTILPSFFEVKLQEGPWPDAPQGRTRREIIARKRGLPIFRCLCFPKKLEDSQLEAIAQSLPLPSFDTGGKPRKYRKNKHVRFFRFFLRNRSDFLDSF